MAIESAYYAFSNIQRDSNTCNMAISQQHTIVFASITYCPIQQILLLQVYRGDMPILHTLCTFNGFSSYCFMYIVLKL